MSSDKVCFKRFDFTYMSIVSMCNYICIPLRIYEFRLYQFSPRLFGSPNVHSTLRSLSKEVFSHRGSTVVTMKPKISCYAYRSQNLDEACILNGCSNWKDARLSVYISFRKHDSLNFYQGSVLKVLCLNLQGHRWNNVKETCWRKKVKKTPKKHVTVWKQFCPAFGFTRDKKYLCYQND